MSERWLKGLLPLLIAVVAWSTATAAQDQRAVPTVKAEVTLGRDVDRAARSLVDPAGDFPADVGRVFCLARVVGADAPTEVAFVWYHGGKTMARVVLPVRSADFRTWSSKRIMPTWTGPWEVKVLDPKGQVLGEAAFVIRDGGAVAD